MKYSFKFYDYLNPFVWLSLPIVIGLWIVKWALLLPIMGFIVAMSLVFPTEDF